MKQTRGKVGDLWYDPDNDVLGLVDSVAGNIAFVLIEDDGLELFVPLCLRADWTESLVYVGRGD